MTPAQALEILALGGEPSPAQIRQAYLAKVKEFPPQTHGAQFQEVRLAYELLKDPREQARQRWQASPQSLADLCSQADNQRRFVGPQAWIQAMAKK